MDRIDNHLGVVTPRAVRHRTALAIVVASISTAIAELSLLYRFAQAWADDRVAGLVDYQSSGECLGLMAFVVVFTFGAAGGAALVSRGWSFALLLMVSAALATIPAAIVLGSTGPHVLFAHGI